MYGKTIVLNTHVVIDSYHLDLHVLESAGESVGESNGMKSIFSSCAVFLNFESAAGS